MHLQVITGVFQFAHKTPFYWLIGEKGGHKCKATTRVGAGCEVWNRVYMIAPVSPDVSPQLRNLAEWDWVPIFLQNKYGGECRHGKTMTFCSVLSFPASKHQENVFMIFCYRRLRHQEACCMNSSWVTSLIMIRHLGKFSTLRVYKLRFSLIIHRTWIFERPACSISYLFPLTVVLRLSSLSLTCSVSLATVVCECSVNQFSTSLFVSLFVHHNKYFWT